MHVNFAFTRWPVKRLTIKSCFVVALFAFLSSFADPVDLSSLAKDVNVSIRQIGHRLLLQSGDSTSRVPPVTEIRKGTFQLKFEKQLHFNHDSLQLLAQELFPASKFPAGYIVTVHDCNGAEIVYGFQVTYTEPDKLPCNGRAEPAGCYRMEFAFPDLYEKKKKEIVTPPRSISSKRDSEKTTLVKADKRNAPQMESDVARVQSVGISSDEYTTSVDASATASTGDSSNYMLYAGMLAVLMAGFSFWLLRKKVQPKLAVDTDDSTSRDNQVPSLGKFVFSVGQQRLMLGDDIIPLTDKECKVLALLHKKFGALISRDTLMQEVWLNEGVITGRSLDMFISKLRKKLSPDPALRITNVHGKGYKLEAIDIASDPLG